MNDTFLQEIGEERNIITTIMKRKVPLIKYVIRHNHFITNTLEGKIVVKDHEEDPNNHISKTSVNEWI